MFDVSAPILILQKRVLANRCVGVDAVTVYGRRITAVVPFQDSTDDGIDFALRQSWLMQLDADAVRWCVLQSFELDMADGYALDDPNPDAAVG